MRIHVVITTHNRLQQLRNCLWSICELGIVKPDLISIVDDASTEDVSILYQLSASFSVPLRILRREREDKGWQSPAVPRNMAIRLAGECDYLWFLEPESLVFANTLQRMLHHFQEHRGESIWVNAVHQGFATRPLTESEARSPEWVWQQPFMYIDPHPHLAVRCALVPHEAVYAVTGYPEYAVGWGGDDTAFMTQLRVYGCRAINDFDIRIIHQWHEAAPADASTANRNIAIMQDFERRGIYAVNPSNWGTDNGKYPKLAV